MKRNNSGFTLVELIVVITIIAIVAAIVGVSVSTVSTARERRCAAEINSLVGMTKTKCLSRSGNVYAVIRQDGDNLVYDYYEGVDGANPTKGVLTDNDILGSGVTVKFSVGEAEKTISGTETLTLQFDRATGSLKSPSSTEDVTITVGERYTVNIVALTGSHSKE